MDHPVKYLRDEAIRLANIPGHKMTPLTPELYASSTLCHICEKAVDSLENPKLRTIVIILDCIEAQLIGLAIHCIDSLIIFQSQCRKH